MMVGFMLVQGKTFFPSKATALSLGLLQGQLMWSAGPVLYQHGYRLGCIKNITKCYFASPPVIDHCEASIFIFNNVGELYSLSVRGPYFKWIQDLSLYGDTFRITPGNNGRLYVTIPDTGVIVALTVSTGSILWQGIIGPLSSADYEPVVDANGDLIKFPELESLNSVVQVNPVLDCSGYAVYISQTEMEGKMSHAMAEFNHVSALKPKKVVFALLVPASGSIYASENDPSRFLFSLSQSDLRHFVVDENTLLAFYAASRNGNPLPCRSTRNLLTVNTSFLRQKFASICSQVKPESISIYTGNERAIILFLLIESIVLVIVAGVVWYCCIFWNKKKLQGLDLGKFLEKRRSLRSQKKEFDRIITELEQKASDEALANEVLGKLSDLVKERESIRRKLSTTYSLGRDGEKSRLRSLLLLHDEKTTSFSFRGPEKESVTMFHTLSDSSSTTSDEYNSSMEDKEIVENVKGKGKADVEVESSSEEEFVEHSVGETEELRKMSDDNENLSRRLRRRTASFAN
ncbi:protein gamete expressed 3 [Phtheirospermum japonicum]|uniref:Protein gamete expressed 3 n=1 Tax=Phtheirospermum japonicum TaxID=374723 RepID=A0A830DEC8_9LAMI|nr:protein gamete expressed 3 [Phtheirospermum japonicum]